AASPPQISRSDLAPPSWQNSMATNCPQLLNPRACRSALCLRAAVSKPVREMSCKICEKMLHTLFKAESSSDSLVFPNSTYQRLSAFFFPAALSTAELIWTRMDNAVRSMPRTGASKSRRQRTRQHFAVLNCRRERTCPSKRHRSCEQYRRVV